MTNCSKGNIGKDDPKAHATAADLVTPTLKADHYTTGRGGSGNMARNDLSHPEIARASQDVDAPVPREYEGPHHFGRGGAANVAKPTEEEAHLAHEHNQRRSEELRREGGEHHKGLVDKGKDLLSKLGKK